jgi:filamin
LCGTYHGSKFKNFFLEFVFLGVSFTPREVGEHLITVKKKGENIPSSPFKIKVSRDQVGDASKVVVSGNGVSTAVCNKENEILVDTRNAGI